MLAAIDICTNILSKMKIENVQSSDVKSLYDLTRTTVGSMSSYSNSNSKVGQLRNLFPPTVADKF